MKSNIIKYVDSYKVDIVTFHNNVRVPLLSMKYILICVQIQCNIHLQTFVCFFKFFGECTI